VLEEDPLANIPSARASIAGDLGFITKSPGEELAAAVKTVEALVLQ